MQMIVPCPICGIGLDDTGLECECDPDLLGRLESLEQLANESQKLGLYD